MIVLKPVYQLTIEQLKGELLRNPAQDFLLSTSSTYERQPMWFYKVPQYKHDTKQSLNRFKHEDCIRVQIDSKTIDIVFKDNKFVLAEDGAVLSKYDFILNNDSGKVQQLKEVVAVKQKTKQPKYQEFKFK